MGDNCFFRLPLYQSDRKPIEEISQERMDAVIEVENKIISKEYSYIINSCLCGNVESSKDIILSEKDRYGFDVKFLLCKECSIIRTDKKLDDVSLSDFYARYYRKIYGNGSASIEKEFESQKLKGHKYKELLEKNIDLSKVNSVLDIGCGAGGALLPFLKLRKRVYGVDYGYERLEFGKSQGIDLMHAIEDEKKIHDKKYDLILLSHVMEHFSDPIFEINNIFEMISDDGYIKIVVPSPLNIGRSPRITSRFFQNVHIFNFNKDYLTILFNKLNMNIIYIDEECSCILKKPNNWKRNDIEIIKDESLKNKYLHILKHLRKSVIANDIFKLNHVYYFFLGCAVSFLNLINAKDYVKRIFYR